MKSELLEETDNRLLKRTKAVYDISHTEEKTPSTASLQAVIAKEKGVEPERVEIKQIMSYRGKAASKAIVYIWDEKKVKNLAAEEKPESEKAEKKEEKKEEPKEEQKEEEKQEEKSEKEKPKEKEEKEDEKKEKKGE